MMQDLMSAEWIALNLLCHLHYDLPANVSWFLDREVRKANRELTHQMNKMNDMDKIDLLTKRSSELFANLKRLERENIKNKKRADQLQKDKDSSRTDLSKQVGLKEKLEKLCRELQKENNKLKVEFIL